MLTVTLPKAELAPKPQPKRITVQSVAGGEAHKLAPAAPEEGQPEAAAAGEVQQE